MKHPVKIISSKKSEEIQYHPIGFHQIIQKNMFSWQFLVVKKLGW